MGRNHPFVAALARWLMESALEGTAEGLVSRCGAIRTRSVSRLTVLLLLRVRYLVKIPSQAELLSEEVVVTGYEGLSPAGEWLSRERAMELLLSQPDENIPLAEKRELVEQALEVWRDAFAHNPPERTEARTTNEEARSAHFSVPERAEARTTSNENVRSADFSPPEQAEACTTSNESVRSADFSPPEQAEALTTSNESVRSADFSPPEQAEARTISEGEALVELIQQRARELEASHKRIRQAVSLRIRELQVQPQLPPDLLGILVLQPVVER